MKAIILCAGKGERLKPLTNDLPKPMILINQRPVLEYLISLCKKHGINEIAINTSYLPEKIKGYFGNGEKFGVRINYSFEPELLGTAGAINNFRNLLNDTFFVIYGDNITDLNLSKMYKFHKSKKALGTLYLYKEELMDKKTTPGCVILDENAQIKEIIERPTEEESKRIEKIPQNLRYMNSGIYILEKEILNIIPPGFSDFSRDILPQALKKGKLYGYMENCYIKEVGQIIRYEKAKQDIESGAIKLNL
jgi:NDP-sugar pyrophosphorylase family protein